MDTSTPSWVLTLAAEADHAVLRCSRCSQFGHSWEECLARDAERARQLQLEAERMKPMNRRRLLWPYVFWFAVGLATGFWLHAVMAGVGM